MTRPASCHPAPRPASMPAATSSSRWLSASFIHLPRHTGDVARRAGGGKPQSRYLQISDLKFLGDRLCGFPPPPPSGAPPPYDGGGKIPSSVHFATNSRFTPSRVRGG